MRILIADDHSIFREGLRQIIKSILPSAKTDEASTGMEALKKIRKNKYSLVTLDISMPDINGLSVLQSMKDSGTEQRVMVISLYPEDVYAFRILKLGAVGYISKSASHEEITHALQKVINGGRYLSQTLAEKLVFEQAEEDMFPHEKLSNREFQVMKLIAQGNSIKEIADIMSVADKTVSTYRTRVLSKMGMRNNMELTYYAITNKLIV